MSPDDIEAREKFLFTLEWLLAVSKRYAGHIQFALAHVDFENPRILGETYGAQKASQKLDEISQALRRVFRATDLVTRDGVDFWILLPYTPADENLSDKISYIIETASQGGLQIVERDISIFSLPSEGLDLITERPALEFLSYLKENHIALARGEVSLPASD